MLGGLAMVNVSVGPSGKTRPAIQCGLYLITKGDDRLALLFRGGASEMHGQGGVTIEIACANQECAASVLAEVKRLTLEHNVYCGHLLSFGSDMFDNDTGPLVFHERERLDRDGLILPAGVLESDRKARGWHSATCRAAS